MRRTAFLLLAAVSAFILGGEVSAEERPRYGGTLRVQLKEAVFSLDPADAKELTAARNRIALLIYDRLTQIDDKGRVRAGLAVSWSSDAERKTWRFMLRPGLSFHDGTALTAAHVITALTNDARWQVRSGNGNQVIVFECANPIYDLPAVLAGVRHSIVLRNADGQHGSGPFRVAAFQPGRQLSLTANLDHFEGRPYLDGVELMMGNSLREQLIDFRLNRDDVVEVDIEQARRLESSSQRVEASAPARLMAIVFRSGSASLRELLARSIDRQAIHSAILKRSGSPAVSLLPQWLTGYAVLFDETPDGARIQKLRGDLTKAPPIYLAFDPTEPMLKLVADRIAVNARDVGLNVQPYAEKNVGLTAPAQSSRADAVLMLLPMGSAHATQALIQITDAAQIEQDDILSAHAAEQRFAAEQNLLDKYKLVPIAHLPAIWWTSSRVRNWKSAPDGRWKLEQLWLDGVK